MRRISWLLILGLVVFLVSPLLSGCSSSPAPAPAPTQSSAPATSAAPAQTTAAASDINKIKEAAIKEGGLNWIDGVVVAETAQKMIPAFKKYYGLPDSFNVKFERLSSGPLASRVQEEVRAQKVTFDLFAIADPALFYDLKKANVLLQYESPEYKNYGKARTKSLTYEPGYWQSAIAYSFNPITNPKVYPKPITSWLDLLGPDFKGRKIEWPTPASGQTPLYTYLALKTVLPDTYWTDLQKQELTAGTSSIEQTQKLTQGENLVTITNPFRIVQTAAQTGVNLTANFCKEGVPLFGLPYGILTQSPHPNAAKLFIDWLYGPEGMKMYVDLENIIVLRDGIAVPESIKKFSPPLDDFKAIVVDWSKYDAASLNKYRDESLKIFGK